MSIQIADQFDDSNQLIHTETDVSKGDAMRARMAFLTAQSGSIQAQTQFADAKAGALMTVLGLVTINGSAPIFVLIQNPIELLATVIMVVSIGLCLVTIMPRFSVFRGNGLPETDNRFSWLCLTVQGYSTKMHGEFARESTFGDLLNSIATHNVNTSRILERKFRLLKIAFFSGLLGSAMLLLSSNWHGT